MSLGSRRRGINLGIHGGRHGDMTGRMLAGIEEAILAERPDIVLVPGDTNSTLAGALAAAKLQVPVAHLEAGLRSFNRAMPEEINRVLTDHLSALAAVPDRDRDRQSAPRRHRRRASINIGDVMYDATLFAAAQARALDGAGAASVWPSEVMRSPRCTAPKTPIPRQACRDHRLSEASAPANTAVVLPLHPRTAQQIARWRPGPRRR